MQGMTMIGRRDSRLHGRTRILPAECLWMLARVPAFAGMTCVVRKPSASPQRHHGKELA